MTTSGESPVLLSDAEPLAGELILAIRGGDLGGLQRLLAGRPGLAGARITDRKGGARSLLHVAADWPGFFPNGPAVVRMLAGAGADPDGGRAPGDTGETPLHWAASSDDVEVAEALILAGADIRLRGGSIAGGTALQNAVGYGCWRVARLLLEHGAEAETLWEAAGLGLRSRVESLFTREPPPSQEEVNHAFWHGCRGGYRRIAEYLFARGADLAWTPDYAGQSALEIAGDTSLGAGRESLVNWLREKSAKTSA